MVPLGGGFVCGSSSWFCLIKISYFYFLGVRDSWGILFDVSRVLSKSKFTRRLGRVNPRLTMELTNPLRTMPIRRLGKRL